MPPYPASYYALQAAEAHRRAQRARDPALRDLIEHERTLWLELDAQSRMLDMVARSMRKAQREGLGEAEAVQPPFSS
jgi:hypothetical protein